MRQSSFVLVGSVVWAMLGLAQVGAAQPAASPTIHRVTVQPDTGVLTITGTGLGPDLFVSVDGQPVTVLPGASDTQMEVTAPATVLTLTGTYRLTVVDPVRQIGDAFVVASPAATVAVGGAALTGTSARASVTVLAGPTAVGSRLPAVMQSGSGPGSLLIEDGVGPYRTALGHLALSSNTVGSHNTAIGAYALRRNTTGSYNTAGGTEALSENTTGQYNTASGVWALLYNTTGSFNTASGFLALNNNTTGLYNTASGYTALYRNRTGARNTASGAWALYFNATGYDNTATGFEALYSNDTGFYNTASGYKALNANTTGTHNTASGSAALLTNTTGSLNTATGEGALYLNTIGNSNTATGGEALLSNTTGGLNTATGYQALYANTIGTYNTASGHNALGSNTIGHWNVAVGQAAGYNATTGSYNVFVGAEVLGIAADTHTIRLGLPYNSVTGAGQNRTFIAGIHGTQVTGSYLPVVVSASGQLGTLIPAVLTGGPAALVTPAAVEQQLQEQRAINVAQQVSIAAQQTTIEDLVARLTRLEAASRRR